MTGRSVVQAPVRRPRLCDGVWYVRKGELFAALITLVRDDRVVDICVFDHTTETTVYHRYVRLLEEGDLAKLPLDVKVDHWCRFPSERVTPAPERDQAFARSIRARAIRVFEELVDGYKDGEKFDREFMQAAIIVAFRRGADWKDGRL